MALNTCILKEVKERIYTVKSQITEYSFEWAISHEIHKPQYVILLEINSE